MNWYILAIQKYTEFYGRAKHCKHWYFALFNTIIIFFIILDFSTTSYDILGALYSLTIIISDFAVSITRLHDTGRSGWNIFLELIPIIGGLILLIFMLQDSYEGVSKYGVYPK